MKDVKVEVIGVDPPCPRCQATKKTVEKVAEKLKAEGINVQVEKVNVVSREVIAKYGVLVSPAIAIDGKVKVMGRVPTEEEVEKLVKEASQ